jgi:hypothetical protein
MYTTPYYDRVMSKRKTGSNFLSEMGVNSNPSTSVPKPKPNTGDSRPDGESFLADMDYQSIAGGIGQGLSSYAQGAADTYDFSVDPNAGFKGSFQGLSAGGAIGAIAGGIGGQMGTFSEVNKNLKALNTDVNLTGETGYGAPSYLGTGYLEANNKLDALNEGEETTKMVYEGGKSIDPATAFFNVVYGTGTKIRRKRDRLLKARTQAQNSFNKSSESFTRRQRANEDYYDRTNISEQLYNLYR